MAKRRANNEGTIFQDKRGYWVAEISLPDGKRKRKYSKKQQVVKEWLLTQRNALQQGLYVEDNKVTVAQFLDHYMTDVAIHHLRPTTYQTYQSLLKNHVYPGIGFIKLSQLRPNHLQAFYTEKLNSGLSKRTVQFIHSIIHKPLNDAMKWGLVVRNVSDLVDAPTPVRKAPDTLTPEQVKTFLRFVEDHPYYPIYILASATGMRESEILSLHWSDVSFENRSLYVRYTLQVVRGRGMLLADPKSEKSKRVIILPDYALDVLRAHRMKSTGERVFATSTGNFISPRNLIRHFKASLKKAGLSDMTFHAFSRHTHATLLLAAGVHPKVVQERLGHSQISLTLDVYSHVLPTLQEDAATKVNALLKQ